MEFSYTFSDFCLAAKNRGFSEITVEINPQDYHDIMAKGYNPQKHKRYFLNKRKSSQVILDKKKITILTKGLVLWQDSTYDLWNAANKLP